MTLGTLDRTPPPIFKQGQSALSKLVLFSALALFLMVADTRFLIGVPLRLALASVLYPGRSLQVEQLTLENQRLRELLTMRERVTTLATGAQVLYDTADPYTRKVVIDRGQTHGILPGSPVIDDSGVLGQVTRVYPLVSEVTLLVDRDQAIPVLNARTGVRGVAYGQPSANGDGLELRYTLANADIEPGDLLTTSGVDGVYPPGLSVARVREVERRAESSFTRIGCDPTARVSGALHVMVLTPVDATLPPSPLPTAGPGRGTRPGIGPVNRPGTAP